MRTAKLTCDAQTEQRCGAAETQCILDIWTDEQEEKIKAGHDAQKVLY